MLPLFANRAIDSAGNLPSPYLIDWSRQVVAGLSATTTPEPAPEPVSGYLPDTTKLTAGAGISLYGSLANGSVIVGLAQLADSGTGTFKLLARDNYGRLSGTDDGTAADVPYVNTTSGLTADDVQEAIDELAADLAGLDAADIPIADAGGYFAGTDVEAALQELGAGGGGGGGAWATVRKTSDETRSSSSSLADDAALKFSVVAGVRYAVRLVAKYAIANATMDFKYSPALTTAFTEEYAYRKQHAPAPSGGTDNMGTQVSTGIINAAVAVVGTATGQGCIELEMTFKATASGTFSFQWAQNTSDAGNLTVLAGSYLEYMSS